MALMWTGAKGDDSDVSRISKKCERWRISRRSVSNGVMLKNNQITINPDGPIDNDDPDECPEGEDGKPLQTKESADRKTKKKKISKTV